VRSRKSIFLCITVAVLALLGALAARAQNREKFILSAHAGGVNAVSGKVEFRSSRAVDWQLLSITDDLKAGDMVKTSSDGRVEMLLNPGSFLRIAEDSEFELADNSLENLQIKLQRGKAIIEATGADGADLAINITTPHARMMIVKRGLYRVNVIPRDNSTELFVKKGRVLLADSHTKVDGGNKVIFTGANFSVEKLDSSDKQQDSFEAWSRDRAQAIAQANRHISTKDLNSFLDTSYHDSWDTSFWSAANGFWFYQPRYSVFTFVPFYLGWGSPYGGGYPFVFDCGCYRWWRQPRLLPPGFGFGGYYRSPVVSTSGSRPATGTGSVGSSSGSGSGSGRTSAKGMGRGTMTPNSTLRAPSSSPRPQPSVSSGGHRVSKP
jgi:hypothetical protein